MPYNADFTMVSDSLKIFEVVRKYGFKLEEKDAD